MQQLIGKTFGKYRIVEHLGRGGMADVFKAHQVNLDRYVALKLMHAHLAADPEFIARFEREAKNIAALRHPNIVQVFDFDTEDNTPYIVMEFVEGVTLKTYLERLARRGEALPLEVTARIVREVGLALAYAHKRNMIHRDVKPANVMVDTSGRMILTDFGLAKILTNPSYTASGATIGTPAYMAPEQAMGAPGDHRADIYSLGVMLYEMGTGRLPFEAETPMAIVLKQISEPLPPPRSVNPNLSEGLEQVILKSLAKNPDDRFSSVDEMLARLEECVAGVDMLPPVRPAVELGLPPVESSRPSATAARAVTQPVSATTPLEVKPPPEPTIPPQVAEFVGREAELDAFAERLAQAHLVVISGMPGVGKTALASALALRASEPAKIFWHSFHAGEGVNVLIWKLAGFLAWRGHKDLWQMLQGAQQTGGQTPPPEVLFDYLFQMLRGQGYLLCLDDFQFVEDDPLLDPFVTRLKTAVEAGQVASIITSRHLPGFVPPEEFDPLVGLNPQDMRRLLDQRGLKLSDDLATTLYTFTEGNAEFLTLAVDTLARGKDPTRLISRLSESDNIERFLMKRVDEGLTGDERDVMSAVAALLGYPGARDAISAVLDGRSVRRTLNDLCSRYLVVATEGEAGKEYSLHAMVQSFYYDLLRKRERQTMHQRAAEYYEKEEPDPLKAARHLHQAGEYERAARLATANVGTLINQGQARALRQVLVGLSAPSLSPVIRSNVHEARGDLEHLSGELDEAIRQYQAAVEVAASADAPTEARLQRKLGDVLARKGKYDEALDSLARGRSRLVGVSGTAEGARLAVVSGLVMLAQGRYDEAAAEAQVALDSLPEPSANSRIAADLHDVLAQVHFYKGHFAQSLEQFQSALEMRRAASDQRGMIKSYNNLAVVYGQQNRYADALRANQAALKIAERIGDVIALAQLYANMAADAIEQGAYDPALEFNQRALALWEKMGNLQGLSMARYNLGEIYQRMERFDLAAEHLTQAAEFAERVGDQSGVVIGMQTLAEVYLAQGNVQDALTRCQASLRRAEQIDDRVWRPSGLRLLGRIYHRLRQWQEARVAFAEACQIWRERETPLDLASTLLSWAQMEHDAGQPSRARELAGETVALAGRIETDDLLRQATALLSDCESKTESVEETQ